MFKPSWEILKGCCMSSQIVLLAQDRRRWRKLEVAYSTADRWWLPAVEMGVLQLPKTTALVDYTMTCMPSSRKEVNCVERQTGRQKPQGGLHAELIKSSADPMRTLRILKQRSFQRASEN